MTTVSTRIDRARTEIIHLLSSVRRDARIRSLTDRIHYLAFRLSEDDLRASNAVREIVLLIETHAQGCSVSGSFLQCLHAPQTPPCTVFICINDQLDKLALIAGKYRCAGY